MDKELTELGWIANQVAKAAQTVNTEEKRLALSLVSGYEDPGEGGFYDDAGSKGRQPHLVKGDSFDASAMMDPNNRPSQNTIAYSLTEAKGIVFRYTGLDKGAAYKVRVTLGAPRIPKEMLDLPVQPRLVLHVLADDEYLVKDVEVPQYTARQFEYDIPQPLTRDGVLELTFERGTGAMGVAVSEVWLIKK